MLSLHEKHIVLNEVAKWSRGYKYAIDECNAQAADAAFCKLDVAVGIARELTPLDYKSILDSWGIKYDTVGYVIGGIK